ncbi:MAG: hypothetical protein WC515_01580 [Candidatus Omnitrophota bacterium]
MRNRGFVIIIVGAFLAVIILVAWAIINIGCGEVLQTKATSDQDQAYLVAKSGAELMYLNLCSRGDETMTWNTLFQPISGNIQVPTASGDIVVGSFTAAGDRVDGDEFGIMATGTVNGKTARVTVQYYYLLDFQSAIPLGSIAAMELYGRSLLGFLKSWVRAEGPLESGSTITKNSYVKVTGDIFENQSFQPISFWYGYAVNASSGELELYQKAPFYTVSDSGDPTHSYLQDLNGDGQVTPPDDLGITDTNGDGSITDADVLESDPDRIVKLAKLALFNTNDTYPVASNRPSSYIGSIDSSDAFYTYYTFELNKFGLGIGPGEANYYSGDQSFGPWTVPEGTSIIFIDGNADILFSDTSWWGADIDHAVISMENITIVQPTNGTDDVLSLIAYGDVETGGVRAFGGVRGDVVIYAHDDFNAYYGGRTDGTIFSEGNIYVDTVLPIPGLLNRDLNKGSIDWTDSGQLPLGLPPGYEDNIVTFKFTIEEDELTHRPVWQRD